MTAALAMLIVIVAQVVLMAALMYAAVYAWGAMADLWRWIWRGR